MLNDLKIQQLMFINTIGMSIIEEAFRTAQYCFINTTQRGHTISTSGKTIQQARESLAFIQGTGLEMVLCQYYINLDADKLRDTFFNTVHHRGHFS